MSKGVMVTAFGCKRRAGFSQSIPMAITRDQGTECDGTSAEVAEMSLLLAEHLNGNLCWTCIGAKGR